MKKSLVIPIIAISFLLLNLMLSYSIPSKIDGFAYRVDGDGSSTESTNILIEAFMDPLCPDSRDAWPPLKQLFGDYSSLVSLSVHPFPLPYHDNSFAACRALHIANRLNASATFPLMEILFKHQDRYSNAQTHDKPKSYIVDDMSNFAAHAIESTTDSFKSGFEDLKTDLATRTSFKFGCLRGVYGTPFFFVNGFPLPNGGSALSYKAWKEIIDPLLLKQGIRLEVSSS